MKKILTNLWFDNNAEEAVNFYTSIFKNSKILKKSYYGESGAELSGREKGSVLTVEFEIEGQLFIALNDGPYFKFTPSISFMVNCETLAEIDSLWKKFVDGGRVMMEFGEYPFGEKYGWLEDRYGLSWQFIFRKNHQIKQKIIPTLMFVGNVSGKAEEAMKFYTSVFNNSKIGDILRYNKGEEPDREGTVKYARLILEGKEFAVMDSALDHKFNFNEAVSFIVNCTTQEETDRFWGKLSSDPNAEQCGWLKDKFGVSWQIIPTLLGELLSDKDPVKAEKVMKAMLQMKKIDIAALKKAYEEEN